MEEDDEEEVAGLVESECEVCYLVFYDIEKRKYCEYCDGEIRYSYSNYRQIERSLEIMDKTHISSFPKILRKMWDYLIDQEKKK